MSDQQPARTPYTLKEPIEFGSETITVLEFRKPKARDLLDIPLSGDQRVRGVLQLAGRLCGQPQRVMEEMSIEDFMEVSSIIDGFTPLGQSTGQIA